MSSCVTLEKCFVGVLRGNMSQKSLVWERSIVREMFVDWQLWPSFIGAKIDPLKVSRGNMPVYVWEEQRSYMDANSQNRDRKRKRESVEEVPPMAEEAEIEAPPSVKRRKDSSISWSSVPSFFTSVIDVVWSAVSTLFVTDSDSDTNLQSISESDNLKVIEPESAVDEAASQPSNAQTDLTTSELMDDFTSGYVAVSHSIVTDHSTAKNKVFSDLQDRGYFIGPADVYGGDYSIYKAKDPTNEHSVATVRVVHSSKVSVKELLTFSRVQNKVAKNAVFAYSSSTSCSNANNASSDECDGEGTKEGSHSVHYLLLNFKAVSERN